MKKILLCLLMAIILTNCELSVQKSHADDGPYHLAKTGGDTEAVWTYKEWNGMKYIIITQYYGGVTTINLTKDELEVQLLKKQLAK